MSVVRHMQVATPLWSVFAYRCWVRRIRDVFCTRPSHPALWYAHPLISHIGVLGVSALTSYDAAYIDIVDESMCGCLAQVPPHVNTHAGTPTYHHGSNHRLILICVGCLRSPSELIASMLRLCSTTRYTHMNGGIWSQLPMTESQSCPAVHSKHHTEN